MGKLKTIELTKAQRIALEKGYREGKSHSFRLRCQVILLKSEQGAAAAHILGGERVVDLLPAAILATPKHC